MKILQNDDQPVFLLILEQQGSSSDEESTKEIEETKPSENVQIDSKLDDFFKVCVLNV